MWREREESKGVSRREGGREALSRKGTSDTGIKHERERAGHIQAYSMQKAPREERRCTWTIQAQLILLVFEIISKVAHKVSTDPENERLFAF